jgi:hypothetical protein
VAGFMNMLFAAPFMIITMASFYRMLDKPSYKRVAFAAALFLILFLAHAHIFLWTGGLCALMTLAFLLIQPRSLGLRAVLRRSGDVVGAALGAVFPALLLFARWYRRTFGEGRASGGVTTTTEGASTHFGAHFPTMTEAFTNLQSSLRIYASTTHVDLIHFAWLAALAGVAVSLARMQRFDKPPVLELCFVVTFVSYFFLPDSMTGHDVISGRQPGVALWFLPALVSPVSSRTSRLARLVVIAGIASLTYVMLHVWHEVLWKFEKYEVAGLEAVMKAAPPRLRLHYAKLDGESKYFNWQPFLHVEGFYMSDKFGQTPDNPGILSTGAIHYRAGVNFHRVVETWGFEREPEIWNNFDLVLVRKWQPEPSNIADARERGVRIAKSHDWELWLSGRASPIEPSK